MMRIRGLILNSRFNPSPASLSSSFEAVCPISTNFSIYSRLIPWTLSLNIVIT